MWCFRSLTCWLCGNFLESVQQDWKTGLAAGVRQEVAWQCIDKGRRSEQSSKLFGDVRPQVACGGYLGDDLNAAVNNGQKIFKVMTAREVAPSTASECLKLCGDKIRRG